MGVSSLSWTERGLREGFLGRLAPGGARRPGEADAPGAHELLQAVRPDELLERVDVLRRARELEHDRVGAEVGDAGVEDLAERHQLRACARRRRHLEQRELALERLTRGELGHTEHVHELVHLLLDLLERVRLAVDAQRDARHVVPFGLSDGKALDVVAAPREHAGHTRQSTRLVLDEDGDGVLHTTGTSVSVSWYLSLIHI